MSAKTGLRSPATCDGRKQETPAARVEKEGRGSGWGGCAEDKEQFFLAANCDGSPQQRGEVGSKVNSGREKSIRKQGVGINGFNTNQRFDLVNLLIGHIFD